MATCQEVESLLPPVVDGEGDAASRQIVEAHLGVCPACRRLADAQQASRVVLRARGAALSPTAPPGLATRLRALAQEETHPARAALGWRARLTAFGAAAAIVIAALYVTTSQSSVVLAAQLAFDHVKCFLIDGHSHLATQTPDQAEAFVRAEYGWDVHVPASQPEAGGLRLVASRKCLLGDGFAAHMLYRVQDQPVSLFIIDGVHKAGSLDVFGSAVEGWTANGRTYVLVAESGDRAVLERVAPYVRDRAQ